MNPRPANDHTVRGGTLTLALAGAVVLTGCVGVSHPSERQARNDLAAVRQAYRPADHTNALPRLTTNSPLADFLTYAMLNQPQVGAAYYDWIAAVERITVERSLPDPRLTFQLDITRVVESVMPGLMVDIPGPGKLGARAEWASAESETRYFAFANAALQAAFDLKKAYYQLHFLTDKIVVERDTLRLLADLETLARARNEVGQATLQDVLRAQIEQERMAVEIANLEDSRQPLWAQFKAALGLQGAAPDPPLPARFEFTPLTTSAEQLLAEALLRNPRLRALEAEVRMAEAGLVLARKGRVPDFNAGLELDAIANPVMVRPQAGMTLPIWRDKLAADLAAAQARKRAATARLTAEQITLAVDFADKLFGYREASRNLELVRERLLPKAQLTLEVARSAYVTGKTDFLNVIEVQRLLLNLRLAEIEARTQRELLLAEISLMLLGVPPAGAPLPGTLESVMPQSPTSSTQAIP